MESLSRQDLKGGGEQGGWLEGREGEVDGLEGLDEGSPRRGTQGGRRVLCLGGGNVIIVSVCTTRAEPRLGW